MVATGKQAKEEALVGSSETKEAYYAVPLEWSSRARHREPRSLMGTYDAAIVRLLIVCFYFWYSVR
jgi:hypothetical protein